MTGSVRWSKFEFYISQTGVNSLDMEPSIYYVTLYSTVYSYFARCVCGMVVIERNVKSSLEKLRLWKHYGIIYFHVPTKRKPSFSYTILSLQLILVMQIVREREALLFCTVTPWSAAARCKSWTFITFLADIPISFSYSKSRIL